MDRRGHAVQVAAPPRSTALLRSTAHHSPVMALAALLVRALLVRALLVVPALLVPRAPRRRAGSMPAAEQATAAVHSRVA